MNEETKYQRKLVVGLVVTIILFFFGSSIFFYMLGIPYAKANGITLKELVIYVTAINESKLDVFKNDALLIDKIKTFVVIIQIAGYIPILIFMVCMFHKELFNDIKDCFKPENFRRNLCIVITSICAILVISYLSDLILKVLKIEELSSNEEGIRTLMTGSSSLAMIIAIVIIGPICEEFLFRKLFIDFGEKCLNMKPVLAIIIGTFVFSFIHVMSDINSYKFLPFYIALSLPLILSYHYGKNNMFVSLLVHIFNNLLTVWTVLSLG